MNTPPLYGRNVEYEPGRVMERHAIIGENDVRSLNFLDYWDERVAYDLAASYSRTATEMVLADRAEPVGNALVLPAAENVFSFIVDDLGMEPRGRLAYVEEMEGVATAGLTTYRNLRSVVVKNNIVQEAKGYSPEMVEGYNNIGIRAVAAHELAHLAGAQDKVFFVIDENELHRVKSVHVPGSKLEEWPNMKKGSYTEEGLSSLTGSMLLWRDSSVSINFNQPISYKAPSGTVLHVPLRILLSGHHDYVPIAWGMERLVGLAPDVWDIFLHSRKYKSTSFAVRGALRDCIDYAVPGLFEYIDNTDIDNVDEMLETTARIDHAARRQKA